MTESLDLNLASRPYRNNTLPWVGTALGAVLLLLFTSWNIQTYRTQVALLEQEQGRVSAIEQELEDYKRRSVEAKNEIASYDLDTLLVQSYKANEVIEWKAFSWTRLFNRMEQVQPWNVQMSSVRPVFRDPTLRGRAPEAIEAFRNRGIPVAVEGVARDLEALFEFERRLFSDPHFDRPEPERTDTLDSREVLFSLRFTYYPEIEEEPSEELEDPVEADGSDEEQVMVEGQAGGDPAQSTDEGGATADVAGSVPAVGDASPQPAAGQAEAPGQPPAAEIAQPSDPGGTTDGTASAPTGPATEQPRDDKTKRPGRPRKKER